MDMRQVLQVLQMLQACRPSAHVLSTRRSYSQRAFRCSSGPSEHHMRRLRRGFLATPFWATPLLCPLIGHVVVRPSLVTSIVNLSWLQDDNVCSPRSPRFPLCSPVRDSPYTVRCTLSASGFFIPNVEGTPLWCTPRESFEKPAAVCARGPTADAQLPRAEGRLSSRMWRVVHRCLEHHTDG